MCDHERLLSLRHEALKPASLKNKNAEIVKDYIVLKVLMDIFTIIISYTLSYFTFHFVLLLPPLLRGFNCTKRFP